MEDKQLLIIALICSIVGLAILFFIATNTEIKEKKINEIDKNSLDENVRIIGTVKKISNVKGISILEVEQPQSIEIVVFDNVELNKGDEIEVVGRVKEYNGKNELVAEKINKFN